MADITNIQVRRGTHADFQSHTLLSGEMAYLTDVKGQAFIGDGSLAGSALTPVGSAIIGTGAPSEVTYPPAKYKGLQYWDDTANLLYTCNGTAWEVPTDTGHGTGFVTQHSDVSDAGSGQIITGTERTNFGTAYSHSQVTTGNPHNLDATDVGAEPSGAIATHAAIAGAHHAAFTSTDHGSLDHSSVMSTVIATDISDISSVGSGAIITSAERSALHARSHSMSSASDHTSPGGVVSNLTAFDASGYPVADSGYKKNDAGSGENDLWSAQKIDAVVSAALDGLDWQASCLSYVDNTAVPPTEVTGNRYILDATGASHANWDGAAANSIVEFNGTTWDEIVPNEGYSTWLENDDNERVFNGSAWVVRASTSLHNNLGSLQGGTSAQYYHLTSADYTALRGGSSDASTLHHHDGRYYTETEIDTMNLLSEDVVDVKGDLLVGTANNTVGRQAVGSNNQVLIADSAQGTGVKWGAVPVIDGGNFS